MTRLDASLLAGIPPFRKLDAGQVRIVLDLSTPKAFDRGQTIFDEGADAERFFLLLDGHIRVQRVTEDGDRVVSLHIPPGQLVGIAVALGRDTYPATAVAAADCLVLGWPTRLWNEFVAEYDGFASETYKVVGARFDEMNTRVMEMATQHVDQRVARALYRLAMQNGTPGVNGVEIAFPMTRRTISEMTGTTLHTVSRLLSAWEKGGIVESRHKHILITDRDRLRKLAGK